MNYQDLIDEITRLVIRELEKQGNTRTDTSNTTPSRMVVVLDPEMKDLSALADILGKIPGNPDLTVVVCSRLSEQLGTEARKLNLRYTPVVAPARHQYARIVRGADSVIIPYLSVTALAKLANLIGDDPAPGIALEALLAGIPVKLCTDRIHDLKFADAERPKKLLAMTQDYLAVVKDMGVEALQLKSLPESTHTRKPAAPLQASSVKNVITNEDIMVAVNRKVTSMNFPRGTIITPLARETARTFGIEINIV